MRKEVKYYLEDTSRLREISQHELDAWIAEKPFHQPLHLLAGIKAEMDHHKADEDPKIYAAYFAEDFEEMPSKLSKQSNKSIKNLTKTIEIPPKVSESKSDELFDNTKITKISSDENTGNKQGEAAESIKGKGTISSDFADEILEEEVILEVLEEKGVESLISISDDKGDKSAIIDIIEEDEIEILETDNTEIQIEQEPQLTDVDVDIEINPSLVEELPKVDYSDFTNLTPKVAKESTEKSSLSIDSNSIKLDSAKSIDITPSKKKGKSKSKSKSNTDLSQKAILKNEEKKKSKKKKKVKSKKIIKSKLNKKNKLKGADKAVKSSKKKSAKKKKSKKKKEIVLIETTSTPTKSKKISTKKGKRKKVKKEEVKKISGTKNKRKSNLKHKSKKGDSKVEYVIVNSPSEKNFKLNDYEGVSNFTSWLLEQESINGKNDISKNVKKEMKKSKKKKSKKKKSKKLKIAQDSIKKQDSIISEPLANILAMQGHKKKAARMYEKLAFVFPEKKVYFEEKIESLKK